MAKETYKKLENIFDYFSKNQNDNTFVDTIASENSNINIDHYITNNGFNIYKYKDEDGTKNTIVSKRKVNNIFNQSNNKSIDTYFHKKEYEQGFNTISCIIGDDGENNVANIEYDSRTSWNNTFFVPPFGIQKGKDDTPSFLFEKAINYIGKNDNYKKSIYKDALNTYNDIVNKTANVVDEQKDDSYESILAEELINELQQEEDTSKENDIRNDLENKSIDELKDIYNDLLNKIEKNKSYLKKLNYNF